MVIEQLNDGHLELDHAEAVKRLGGIGVSPRAVRVTETAVLFNSATGGLPEISGTSQTVEEVLGEEIIAD